MSYDRKYCENIKLRSFWQLERHCHKIKKKIRKKERKKGRKEGRKEGKCREIIQTPHGPLVTADLFFLRARYRHLHRNGFESPAPQNHFLKTKIKSENIFKEKKKLTKQTGEMTNKQKKQRRRPSKIEPFRGTYVRIETRFCVEINSFFVGLKLIYI